VHIKYRLETKTWSDTAGNPLPSQPLQRIALRRASLPPLLFLLLLRPLFPSSLLLLRPTPKMTESRPILTSTVIDEDWEEWTPEKGSFLHHMMAGSAAGVAEHVSIFPIDTIKVRHGRGE
jgi:hypothetical protein